MAQRRAESEVGSVVSVVKDAGSDTNDDKDDNEEGLSWSIRDKSSREAFGTFWRMVARDNDGKNDVDGDGIDDVVSSFNGDWAVSECCAGTRKFS